jgi:hypothetical protein
MKLKKFERHVLEGIHRLEGRACTLPLRLCIEQKRGRWLIAGKMYVHVNALEERGLVTSELRPGGPDRGYRPRRFYSLTAEGKDTLDSARECEADP